MTQGAADACLILHRKSCTLPEVEAAIAHVRESGINLEVEIPWSGADLRKVTRRAIEHGVRRIVAGGGDGTLNAVASDIMSHGAAHDVSLGIMPLGTANDFARGAGIPMDDLNAALQLACTGEASAIDVGQMNDRYFINVASAGFGAEITATTSPDMKSILGGAAYTVMGFIKAFQLQPYQGRLILPDGTEMDGSMLLMAVGNNRFAGGGYEVAPQASLTDGLLDVAIVRALPAVTFQNLIAELQDPLNPDHEHLLYRQLPAFTIEMERPLHVNLDGEPITGHHFTFASCPQALSVVLGDAAPVR